ncbi:MAG: hypothetical protein A2513_05360 [Sulfurimonas sp. RIFOXYD12_FULL_33_39]|uniref:glycosyltransferase family protein n=1 Tax=unclassified Sulfurimonas TaxID=2623549 RepID=UPI0008B5FC61|nr:MULTISPECIES: glycosyltransferase [unclassified Sulfurimonas]OHE10299.1 MAG: hypothetical protein A2513_05360 [Sulfurimonas sp. RIFOXYD12_FULL_33_39]OHE13125.1 MAG: hypothetical protein A2530_11595 [Sulfurimonas sp. RIFOXYD2_FULL_34_21]DAB28569.1 MAG TPA: hypothetical protein CFH78_01760 [Sulfurimonas sp. UBA10385]
MANTTLALFMPSKTSFYEGLFESMKKAFEVHNYTVVGGCGFLESNELISFIDTNKPKVFFEMNRCKSEINNFPKEVLHVCWLVDLLGRRLEEIKGSEIVYFFSTEWMKDFKPLYKCKIDWLPPATDSEVYYPVLDSKKVFQSVFLGHIPNPWSEDLLQRAVYEDKNEKILFLDILENFEQQWASQDKIVNNDSYMEEVSDWFKSKNLYDIEIRDKILRYDIGCRIIRKARRTYFIDWLLQNADVKPLAIFGGANWKNWSQYEGLYQKELHTPSEINSVFNQSNIVLHEGVGLHFRVFDAMATGVPVLVRKSEQDSQFGGIGTIFEENKDYVSIDINNCNNFKISQEKLNSIAIRAREEVLKNHTWFHRLSKVIRDIDELE